MHYLEVLARSKPDATVEQANAELSTITDRVPLFPVQKRHPPAGSSPVASRTVPGCPGGLLQRFHPWLVPAQGLVAAALGALFVERRRAGS